MNGKTTNYLKWLSGIIIAIGVLLKPIDWYIDYRIEIGIKAYQSSKTNSLSYKLAKKIGVDREDVDDVFGEMYNNNKQFQEDIKNFNENILPMLEIELNTIDVGLKVNRTTNQLQFLHIDGLHYSPSYWPDKRDYYFTDSEGHWRMCH